MGVVRALIQLLGVAGVNLIFHRSVFALQLFGGAFLILLATFIYKNVTAVSKPPPWKPVQVKGKVRVCCAGYQVSPPTAKAHALTKAIASKYASKS